MNAVEIEQAISELANQPFDPGEFPFSFLEAFGNKATTIKRLRSGTTNSSDAEGGVLQRNNIHIAVCASGTVTQTLQALKASSATDKAKAKFILATDGENLEAEDLRTGETVACEYNDFPNHFGFFLPLAGITTVKEIRNNPIDIQATSRLNRLYVELLKQNEDWASEARRHEMNQFMARLIFCFFAEDTEIFEGDDLFTSTVEQMSDSRSENTGEVIAELFRAMDTPFGMRENAKLPRWADKFPWVNGGLFDGSKEVPKFSRIARSYLLHAGHLDWQKINPDIFGSMIQAVADDDERGELGMHYTSVPNILKVLNPLFLNDLREQLEAAGDNARKLLNLRKRIASIRVFDPACGSGNFLVIAYLQMREIEAEILKRRGEANQRSWLKLENFYGIEIKDFACEVARLSLLIAEFQSDVKFIGQKEAKALVLPLKKTGQIHQGNALRMNWLEVCPPITKVVTEEYDLAGPTGRLALEESGLELGTEPETYICSNPPYLGSTWQTKEHKADLERLFKERTKNWKSLDYVAGWYIKATDYVQITKAEFAFVSTNSICQGSQVSILWPLVFESGAEVIFAHTSFKWANLASRNAGVTVIVVGVGTKRKGPFLLFENDGDGTSQQRLVDRINAYLIPGKNLIVSPLSRPTDKRATMLWGNKPTDGGHLFLSSDDRRRILEQTPKLDHLIRPFYGAQELIRGDQRYCLWIEDEERELAETNDDIVGRISAVAKMRSESKAAETRPAAAFPHRFRQIQATAKNYSIVVGRVSSEQREYLPVALLDQRAIIGDRNFAMYDAPLWNFAVIVSRVHRAWVGAVCVRLEMRFSYSNTLGWNTFPIPTLTAQNIHDLSRCAEDILLAREAYFPATIADLYDPEKMPDDLRAAHERNDEVLERIYIGRRFKNDSERLEKLFELYTDMTTAGDSPKKAKQKVS